MGKGGERSGGYFDDNGRLRLSPSFVITNQENRALADGKVTLVVFGQHVARRDTLMVLTREETTTQAAPLAKQEFEGKEVEHVYDDTVPVLFGFKHHGYLITVQNAAGEVIFMRANPSSLTAGLASLSALQTNTYWKKDFKPTTNPGYF